MENAVYVIDSSTTPPTTTKIPGIVSGSFHYSSRTASSGDPRIGGVFGSYIEFDYFTPSAVSVNVGDIISYSQLVDVDSDFNPINYTRGISINRFIVKSIAAGNRKNHVVAYDCVEKLNVNYSQRLKALESSFPMKLVDLISDIMSFTGLTTNMTGSSAPWVKDIVLNYFYVDGITARDIIGYAAEVYGECCRSVVSTYDYIFSGMFFVNRTGTPWGDISDSVITPDDGDYTSIASAYKDIWYKENSLVQSSLPPKYDGLKIISSDGQEIAYVADSADPSNIYYITNNLLIDNINSLAPAYTFYNLAQYIFGKVKTNFLYHSDYNDMRVSSLKLFPFRMPFSAGDIAKIINPDGTLSKFPIVSLDLTESAVTLESLGNTDTYYQPDMGDSSYNKTVDLLNSQVNRLSDTVNQAILVRRYSASVTIPGNGGKSVTQEDLGVTAIDGYSVAGVIAYNTSNDSVLVRFLSNGSTTAGLRNISGSSVTTTFYVFLLFVRNEMYDYLQIG